MSYSQTFFLKKNENLKTEWDDKRVFHLSGQRQLESILRRNGNTIYDEYGMIDRIEYNHNEVMNLIESINTEISIIGEIMDETLYSFYELRSSEERADRIAMDSYSLLRTAQDKINNKHLEVYESINDESPINLMIRLITSLSRIMADYKEGDILICHIR